MAFSFSGQSQLTPSRLLHNRIYVTELLFKVKLTGMNVSDGFCIPVKTAHCVQDSCASNVSFRNTVPAHRWMQNILNLWLVIMTEK